jgi:hypothetical protein
VEVFAFADFLSFVFDWVVLYRCILFTLFIHLFFHTLYMSSCEESASDRESAFALSSDVLGQGRVAAVV